MAPLERTGQAAEHGRLVANIMYFARTLRAAGLPIGPGKVLAAVEAVRAVGISDRQDFYWTLHAVFVNRRDQREHHHHGYRRQRPRSRLHDHAPPPPHRFTRRLRYCCAATGPSPRPHEPMSEPGQQRWQQRQRREHRQEHGDHRRDGEAVQEADAGGEHAQQRDHHGCSGEQDRPSRGVHRLDHRCRHLVETRVALPEPGHDEQRIVDPNPQSDH